MKLFFVLLSFVHASLLFAGSKTNTITGSAITVGTAVETSGPYYSSPSPQNISNRTWWIENTYGLVKLSYPIPASGIRPTGDAKVVVKIDYQIESNGQYVSKTVNKELFLSLASATATDVAYFKVEDAQYIKATVSTGTQISPNLASNLSLSTVIETNSFEKLARLDEATVKTSLSATHILTTDGNLKISWSTLSGAEAYHLEWT